MPGSREKIQCLDVEDPIGLGMMVYEKTINQIEKKIRDIFHKIV
jgi:protein-tyrosine-phosphatase